MIGNGTSVKEERNLGITRLEKTLVAEPDYVRIAIRWFHLYQTTNDNRLLSYCQHYIRVAEELGQCVRDDPGDTQEHFLGP